jgi:hypothetical protein
MELESKVNIYCVVDKKKHHQLGEFFEFLLQP